MAPEPQQRARQLFDQALERPQAERKAFVDHATAGDTTLRAAVEQMLDAQNASQSFLESTFQDTGQIGRYVMRENWDVAQWEWSTTPSTP